MSTAAEYPPPSGPGSGGPDRSKPTAMIIQEIPPMRNGGPSPSPQPPRTIAQLDAEVRRRLSDFRDRNATISQILQAAEQCSRQSEILLRTRERRDQAYVEYAVAYDLVMVQIQRSPDYHNMMASKIGQNYHQARNLGNRLFAKKDQFKNIRAIIENENKRNTLATAPIMPSQTETDDKMRPLSHDTALPGILTSAQEAPMPANGAIISPTVPAILQPGSPKSKPSIKPKPESLHGKSLSERFAALRVNGTPSSLSSGVEPAGISSVLAMPDATTFQPVPSAFGNVEITNQRPAGPRPMPSSSDQFTVGPAIPPKLPLDTTMTDSFPRAPSPAYSPARNMQTPSSINPPRTSARSIVGTGGRAASAASARAPNADYESSSYFPNNTFSSPNSDSRRRGVVGLALERTITAERLFDLLKMYDILLIDVRSRPEFDDGHIDTSSIICVEPLQLRPGISASDVENSLSISPDAEETIFHNRSRYDFVVFYDQSSSNPAYTHSPQSQEEENLRILHDALVEYDMDGPLRNPPMLLEGGVNAWVDMLGQASLQTSRTHIGRPSRQSISRLPSMANSLSVGRRRHREWNPLNAEEERQWHERARTESVSMPAIPDIPEMTPVDIMHEEQPGDDVAFYRSRDDFLRRYPAVPMEQQSMVAPPRYDSRQQPPAGPQPITHPTYLSGPSPHHDPAMPSRPAPTAPRVSYSGAHDHNDHQPNNVVRNKNLIPYISPQEKPSNVRIPRTGLVNFGSTCYMNSVIQCLSATVPLTMRFQDGSYKKWLQRDNWKGSRGLLPEHFANLVSNLWLNDVAACRPMTFRKFCARLNPDWGTDRQQDAHDFYNFVMEYLHEDLNVFWRNPPPHVLSKQEEESREKLPMFLAASIEWDRWTKRERSLISDLFAGQHASQLRCLTCKSTSTTYEPWYNLSIELPARGNVKLEECLASYCREERLSRGHEWCCPRCNKTRDATKRITLTKAPPYLVVHFKRFHADSSGNAHKVSTVVNFPLQGLDLAPYMLTPPTQQEVAATPKRTFDQSILGPFKYNAYAIVEHFGRGLSSGHYIGWVHDRPRNVWRKFDDSQVSDLPAIRPAGAYLVFYERVNWTR